MLTKFLVNLEEESKELKIKGKIEFDKIAMIEENKDVVWSPDLMQLYIDTKRTEEFLQEVKFDGVKCITGVMNELLDVTL